MNAIFLTLTLFSVFLCIILSPESVITALLGGAEKSVALTISLIAVYSVWMGIFEIAKNCQITDKIAKILYKPISLLFKNTSKKAKQLICLNISANALGLGGVATPIGIEACTLLEKQNNKSASELLFIISATSVQILPTSVLALASSYGSSNPSDLILPSLLTTLFSTTVGIVLFKIFSKDKK